MNSRQVLTRKVILLFTVVGLILLYLFWQKESSETKLSAFQRFCRDENSTFSLTPSDTILVIAPHCDDEVLGAGGIIHDAQRQGAQVYVVIITNGDAFRVFWTKPKKAIELGYRRQRESIEALSALGVPRERIFFLGYPDQGLALLWKEYWSSTNPFFSRFTRTWMDSYFTSYRPGTIYSGENLTLELEQLMTKIQPTIIITASPFDHHSDHWATYNFTVYALEMLRMRGTLSACEPRLFWYLIHYGVWSYASGSKPQASLLPPPQLLLPHLNWHLYPLSPATIFAKNHAIRKYRSQSPLGEHLLSFVRQNELLGQELVIQVPTTSSPLPIDGNCNDWPSSLPRYREPQREAIWKSGNSFSDFTIARSSESLYLAFRLEKENSTKNRYFLHFYPVFPASEKSEWHQSVSLEIQLGKHELRTSHPSIQGALKENVLEIAIPLELLPPGGKFFFQAEMYQGHKTIDRTAWYLLHLVE